MNWTKQNISIIIAIIMAVIGVAGFYRSWQNDRESVQHQHDQSLIFQHDMEGRLDSIQNAFGIFMTQFNELQKNRTIRLKETDEDKRQNDLVHYEFGIRLTKIETRFDDLLIKLKK